MAKKKPKTRPETTFGPYPGGVGVAVWLNEIDGDDGPRKLRSITIDPRRYYDQDSGEWRDASSFRPGDIPVLLHALQKAQEYVFETPLPGDDRQPGDEPF